MSTVIENVHKAERLVGWIAASEAVLTADEKSLFDTVNVWLESHYTITDRQVEGLKAIAKRVREDMR